MAAKKAAKKSANKGAKKPASAAPGALVPIVPAVPLSTESRVKFTALGNAWVLAKISLAKPVPKAELKWVQTVANATQGDQLPATLLSEYTNAPETKSEDELAALAAFADGALILIKTIAAEAPADAAALMDTWVTKLEYYENDLSKKASALKKGVTELKAAIKAIAA
jgi:hypothetical protein